MIRQAMQPGMFTIWKFGLYIAVRVRHVNGARKFSFDYYKVLDGWRYDSELLKEVKQRTKNL